jgi:putative ABC transport system substrate-binding protein
VDRRAFIAGIAGGLLAAPLAAEAQQAEKVYRIGVLLPLGLTPPILARFVAGMRDRGWVENQGFGAEPRYAEGRLDRLPELAATLVRLRVDVLVTMGTPATIAAKQATSTIPIVFGLVGDAVGAGIVPKTSHARVGISPGWPCTGPRWAARGLVGERGDPTRRACHDHAAAARQSESDSL